MNVEALEREGLGRVVVKVHSECRLVLRGVDHMHVEGWPTGHLPPVDQAQLKAGGASSRRIGFVYSMIRVDARSIAVLEP
jgi:hypothetical protein